MSKRSHYWSCSKLANLIRGSKKPYVLTSEGWHEWNEGAKAKHPIRYWIAEDGLDLIQNFINWPIDKLYDVRYYINNRWISRSHALTAHTRDIKPGRWCDVGNRFLPCLFNELVDFVEVETAWHHCLWSDSESKKYNVPWWRKSFLKLRRWRCPEAGIASLEWQSKLIFDEEYSMGEKYYGQPTPQALAAQEILALYKWWTETYRNRPDAYDASGWSASCDAVRQANGGKFSFNAPVDPELKKQQEEAHRQLQKIESDYRKEDEDMLIRLIKIRDSLWT